MSTAVLFIGSNCSISTVRTGKPIRYNPINNPINERACIKNLLERAIYEMILHASQTDILQMPLPN
jgi:hypothetical protein